MRVKALLGPDQLAGVESGKLDRPARMTIEVVEHQRSRSSKAATAGTRSSARGASGKDIRQLFERQGVLVSRILRVSMGAIELDKSLSRGQFRQLDEEEIETLLRLDSGLSLETAGP